MYNTVIKVLNRAHGKKVIEYFNSHGINTIGHRGVNTAEEGNVCIYYGVINNKFGNYPIAEVMDNNAEIIELPNDTAGDMITDTGRLDYARKTYTPGTKFISPENGRTYEVGKFITIKTPIYEGLEGRILTRTESGGHGEFIYFNGKWAEIIKEEFDMDTNEGRLAYAKKHYSIGTKYVPIDCGGKPYVRKHISTYEPRLWDAGLGIEVGDGLIYHLLTNTWAEIIKETKKEEKVMETQKLSRQGLKEIHEVACGKWKEKLLTYGTRNPLEDYIVLSTKEVNEMFKACDTKQKAIVSKYLTEKAPKDFESIIKNISQVRLHDLTQGLMSTRVGGKHEYKAFVLDNQFDWIMEFDNNGFLCLIPTNKD